MEKKDDKELTPGKFWGQQPVAQTKNQLLSEETERPIDELKTVDDIKDTPLTLPPGFSWYEVDIDNDEEVRNVCELFSSC
jgi:hypothetical protein